MSIARKTVLLVDDDQDFLLQQKTLLQAAGFDVAVAQGRAEAETVLQKSRPDLAVVDLMMEHMDDGFALCHEIKTNWPNVPVILVTAVARETGLEFDPNAPKGGSWIKADAMLAKPIRFEQLKREIDRLCG